MKLEVVKIVVFVQGLVKKLVCNDFASNTVQRFYQFNMSLDHVVTNMISGEQCIRYQLTRLPGTNTFLGVVNTTCDLVTAFCPCNTVSICFHNTDSELHFYLSHHCEIDLLLTVTPLPPHQPWNLHNSKDYQCK